MAFPVLRAWRAAAALFFALILAGCAGMATIPEPTLARDTLDDFMLEGRFSLRQEEKSYSGKLSWRHASGRDELLLSSPLGQGVAEITADADEARLTTSDGKAYSAADAQTLTENVLGYRLPLALLTDWVRGRGMDDATKVERDEYGRPLRLRHEEWRIEYGYDSDAPSAPPGRLFAEREGSFELRLRIDEWTRLPPAPRQKTAP